jgi:hypothetical protein
LGNEGRRTLCIEHPNSARIQSSKIDSVVVPLLTLSMGIKLLSHLIQRAEYYPCGSVGSSALINGVIPRHVGASATYEQNFLCIRTTFGNVRVRGIIAAHDAIVLEEAGIQVYRSPKDSQLLCSCPKPELHRVEVLRLERPCFDFGADPTPNAKSSDSPGPLVSVRF